VLIGREIGTGTRFVFEDKVAKTTIPIRIESNATNVLNAVAATPGSLGYAATGFIDGHQDLVITYQGVAPTPENIRNHTYAFATDEHLYTLKTASAGVGAFVQYVKNDAALLKANGVF
jgi:ABC-type phosphate transport system substrate-binding protein